MKRSLSKIIRCVTAGVLCALLVGYAVPKWSLVIPVRAAEAVTAEEKQAVKKLEEELAVLKKNRSFAQETYEAALAAFEAAELDYIKAKDAKEALDAEISALESEIETTNRLLETYNEQLTYYTAEIAAKEVEIEEKKPVEVDEFKKIMNECLDKEE